MRTIEQINADLDALSQQMRHLQLRRDELKEEKRAATQEAFERTLHIAQGDRLVFKNVGRYYYVRLAWHHWSLEVECRTVKKDGTPSNVTTWLPISDDITKEGEA